MNIADVVNYFSHKVRDITVPVPDVSCQFHLKGEGGGDLYAETTGGRVTVREGRVAKPDITVTLGMSDLEALLEKRADATSLYFKGKIHVEGDLLLAMRLARLLG